MIIHSLSPPLTSQGGPLLPGVTDRWDDQQRCRPGAQEAGIQALQMCEHEGAGRKPKEQRVGEGERTLAR